MHIPLFSGVCAHSSSASFCYLGDANPIHPLVQSPDVITAQVLDVLRFLLDLRMLQGQERTVPSEKPLTGKRNTNTEAPQDTHTHTHKHTHTHFCLSVSHVLLSHTLFFSLALF